MIALFLVATLIAAAGPAPTATPAALKEIGAARGSGSVCGNLVVHANSAIAATLRDDIIVTRAIARLRNIDLNNIFSRREGLGELSRLAAELGDQSARGDGEVKRLRDQANRSDSSHKAEVRVFTDDLSAALGRQKKIATDLDGFLTYLDYRELREAPDLTPGGGGNRDPFRPSNGGLPPMPAPTQIHSPYERAGNPNAMALAAAADFEARSIEVRSDEAKAAEHSEAAVSGCS